MQVSRSPRFATLLTAAATLLAVHLPAAEAAEMVLTVSESQIVSLANAPALLSFDQFADQAGRPVLRLEVEFANECYAGVGADLRLWRSQPRRSDGILVVSQRVPPDGCPDIFQPVRRSLGIDLPQDLSTLHLVARPAPESVVRTIRVGDTKGAADGTTGMSDLVETSRVVPALTAPSVSAPAANGYVLTGRAQLSRQCLDGLRAQVFEVPDQGGSPRNDVVLLTAPAGCTAGNAESEIAIRVNTPQPRRGRTVTLLNASPPTPMQLPD